MSPADIVAIAGDDNRMRHVLFARYGLGFGLLETIYVREAFGDVPLDERTMERMLKFHAANPNPNPEIETGTEDA